MKLKKVLPDIIAILAFIIISFAYFFPADIEGRIIFQHDTSAGVGIGQEAADYYKQTGERTRWTDAAFGGMPTYQISPSYDSVNTLTWLDRAYRLFLPAYVSLTFILLLGFYLLMRALGIPAWLSTLGSIAWAFSSYFCILIAAGHIWKFVTLAFIPPTIAGMIWAYRGRLWLGGAVTAFFFAMQILSNHLQMTYYFLFVMLFIALSYFFKACKEKQMKRFWKATAVLLVASVIGVTANISNIYHTYTYSKETMRGKSELVVKNEAGKTEQSGGLEKAYITQWSYGIGETLTLLIPDFKGGASVPLSENSTAMAKANPMYGSLYTQLTQYFGTQPMTAGPVYVGAFVLFLFIWGCFLVKGPIKWALLGATIFSIVLAWGKNFMPITDFFIDYVPLYNKFRAVSSILVIAEFTIPTLAILALWKLVSEPFELKQQQKPLMIASILTFGVSILTALAPGWANNFISPQEYDMLQGAAHNGMIPASELSPIMANLSEMRAAMVSLDAWRSVVILLIGGGLLFLFLRKKLNKYYFIGGVTLLCFVDLWSVDKRYLNDSLFVDADIRTNTFKPTHTDQLILQDKDPDYRVLNFASNTFNENNTSYWHKSVGGYHAAKLRRYQEMIDHYIAPEMEATFKAVANSGGNLDSVPANTFKVINMLNTKYFIFPIDRAGNTAPIRNPYAMGNAWFVKHIDYVQNANEEMDGIKDAPLATVAVVDNKFKGVLDNAVNMDVDSVASIRLIKYAPNELVFQSKNSHSGVAVFSEIYYPKGWNVTIDGKKAELARANYILRALYIPAGEHTVVMQFKPHSISITETIAYIALLLLFLGIVIAIVQECRTKKQIINNK